MASDDAVYPVGRAIVSKLHRLSTTAMQSRCAWRLSERRQSAKAGNRKAKQDYPPSQSTKQRLLPKWIRRNTSKKAIISCHTAPIRLALVLVLVLGRPRTLARERRRLQGIPSCLDTLRQLQALVQLINTTTIQHGLLLHRPIPHSQGDSRVHKLKPHLCTHRARIRLPLALHLPCPRCPRELLINILPRVFKVIISTHLPHRSRIMVILDARIHVSTCTGIEQGSLLIGPSDSLAASHQQYPTNYSAQYPEQQQSFNADTYNATGYLPTHGTGYSQQSPYHPASTPYAAETQQPYTTSAYPTSAPQPQHTPERSYTLGGDNYANTYAQQQYPSQHAPERSYTLGGDAYTADAYTADANAHYPPPQPHQQDVYARYSSGTASSIPGHMPSPYSPQPTPSPSTMSTQSSNMIRAQSMHKSPLPPSMTGGSSSSQQTHSQPPSSPQRQQQQQSYHEEPIYEDSPPVYDVATAQPPGEWNSKR